MRSGDTLILSTDGFWSLQPVAELESVLATGSITETLPVAMRQARQRGGQEADNLSLVAMTWQMQGEGGSDASISTVTMPLDAFTKQFSASMLGKVSDNDDISDEEIEQSIAEIQAAIKRYTR
jgi:hypothetical protein